MGPYIVFNDLTGERIAFKDPADALELKVQYGLGCTILDSDGTTLSINQLEKEINIYNTGKELTKKVIKRIPIDVHTDGSSMNPGPGGYAAILVYKGKEKTVQGFDITSTNNRMELKAVVEAIKALDMPCDITVHTDSQYLCFCSQHDKAWFEKSEKKNQDLWFELIMEGLKGRHKIKFVKVRGHSGDAYNERCDKLAKEQMKKAKHEILRRMTEDGEV